ncbi:MAG: DNA topoisomerase IV subunit A [Rhodothermales bacterium]
MPVVDVISLQETARERYLNYAMSVITSRALPDIRDGLKPVQRRILYAMYTHLHLYPDGRFRKSATIVGDVMGKLHPHGDSAIYDAMVRMAQDFSLRAPLVNGHGNFGSLDGDKPAAMRYTEAKLRPLAVELLSEIKKKTVNFRPNFDGTLFEPIVLPAKMPNLLVNGATGIAVGMATNIPPHNLAEVVDALIYMIQSPNARVQTLVEKFIKGPDFPTGGEILNSEEDLVRIYEKGEGPVEMRGQYVLEGKKHIVITSVPYTVNKADLIEQIAARIEKGSVPQLIDIRDESTDVVRIVLDLKRGANPDAAMAYLYKHTSLKSRFNVNLTCLVPTDNPDVPAPKRVDLVTVLREFLRFRMEVVVRRLTFELEQLEKRIHILKGFEIIFNALDEAIKIIRASKNKKDAAQRLMHRFRLDDVQTDAILETKLYKLSQLEIDAIREELDEKERQADEIRALLADEPARWSLIRKELRKLKKDYGEPRRTSLTGPAAVLEYTAEAYIVAEDVSLIVTRDGWIKRQRSYTGLNSIRVRDGDQVQWAIGCSTRSTATFCTNVGRAYTALVDQLPSTTGYGDPVQKLFDFTDGERIVGVIVHDDRVLPKAVPVPDAEPQLFGDGAPPDPETEGACLVALTEQGNALRMPLSTFAEPSNKNGRLFTRLQKGDRVLRVEASAGDENVCMASEQGNALIFPVQQISIFKNPAKGVIAMRLGARDRVLGYVLSNAARQGLEVETSRGRREIVRTTKFEVTNRGNKGKAIIQRGTLTAVVQDPVEIKL